MLAVINQLHINHIIIRHTTSLMIFWKSNFFITSDHESQVKCSEKWEGKKIRINHNVERERERDSDN